MNTERRPLTATLNAAATPDPAAVREFVTQERRPTVTQVDTALSGLSAERQPHLLNSVSTPRKRRAKSTGVSPVGLIPVTVRLRPEVAGALKRASLERQLTGDELFTQQDIVAQVLEPWLREEGYLS